MFKNLLKKLLSNKGLIKVILVAVAMVILEIICYPIRILFSLIIFLGIISAVCLAVELLPFFRNYKIGEMEMWYIKTIPSVIMLIEFTIISFLISTYLGILMFILTAGILYFKNYKSYPKKSH